MAEAKNTMCLIMCEQLEIRLMNGSITREEYQDKLEELADFLLA